jgi:hypothetical protein
VIFPILKEGDVLDPGNYRGITLLSVVGKLFGRVLNARLMRVGEQMGVFGQEQGGFRVDRRCPERLFVLHSMLSQRLVEKKKTLCAFVDLRKAYDRVWRDGLWKQMWEKGVRGKAWRVVREMYRGVKSAVLVEGEASDYFEVEIGVRQGDVLSPWLFNIFVEGLVDKLRGKELGIRIEGRLVGIMLFADDIVLLADDEGMMQRMLDELSEWCKQYRMEVNETKSAVLCFGGKVEEGTEFKICDKVVEVRKKYKYLGVWVNDDLDWKDQVRAVRVKGEKAVRLLNGLWVGQNVGLRVKKNVW